MQTPFFAPEEWPSPAAGHTANCGSVNFSGGFRNRATLFGGLFEWTIGYFGVYKGYPYFLKSPSDVF